MFKLTAKVLIEFPEPCEAGESWSWDFAEGTKQWFDQIVDDQDDSESDQYDWQIVRVVDQVEKHGWMDESQGNI